MAYTTEHIAKALKTARQSKGLSQRELSRKAGVPQSHISKIENGAVDLRLSSLVALARALDLELTLVPRKTAPAVDLIVQSATHAKRADNPTIRFKPKELKRLQDNIARVTEAYPAVKELAQLQHQARALENFHLAKPDIGALVKANQIVEAFKVDPSGVEVLQQALSEIRSLRNVLAHAAADLPQSETVRPAYSLDEDDHG